MADTKRFDGKAWPERRVGLEQSLGNPVWLVTTAGAIQVRFAEYRKTPTVLAVQMQQAFEVETLEGLMVGHAGDWLACGAQGELYPLADAVFGSTYEPVPTDTHERPGAEPSGVAGTRSADAPPAGSSDGGSPETERAIASATPGRELWIVMRHPSDSQTALPVIAANEDDARQTAEERAREIGGRWLVVRAVGYVQPGETPVTWAAGGFDPLDDLPF